MTRRADEEKLRDIFLKYASIEKDGKRYMSYHDLVGKFLGILPLEGYNERTLALLAHSVDTNRNGLISFSEFHALEGLLCRPDCLHAIAFAVFDNEGTGVVSLKQFQDVIKHTENYRQFPIDFDSRFHKSIFGQEQGKSVSYLEFTQVLREYNRVHYLTAFDRITKSGLISASEFETIITTLCPHLLSPLVKQGLETVTRSQSGSQAISYPFFMGIITLLSNMELIKKIYLIAAEGSTVKGVTKEEFLGEAGSFTQVTPLEVDILYKLVGLRHSKGKMNLDDVIAISPVSTGFTHYHLRSKALQERVQDAHAGVGRSFVVQMMENFYRFALASVAGAIGATAVYPIDLVKTRMQNQRSTSYVGELMYKNSVDCFKKVVKFEGLFGLYRGLTPQLVGVAPEKAIKLTTNDFMRDKLTKDGNLPFWAECIAGGSGGAMQVMFTNPLEIVKIRLQVAGEIASTKRIAASHVIRELGFKGLYKGSRACFLRDIPFSAIYFPFYSHNKRWLADESGYNSVSSLLFAATLSGVPAAALVTPADVIKTRLQVAARAGQTTYNGILDCARKVIREEGGSALWKGTTARVFRSSPQFGVTLFTYEMLQRAFYVDFGGSRPEGSNIQTPAVASLPDNPDHVGGFRLAHAAFIGVEERFGLRFPKYSIAKPVS